MHTHDRNGTGLHSWTALDKVFPTPEHVSQFMPATVNDMALDVDPEGDNQRIVILVFSIGKFVPSTKVNCNLYNRYHRAPPPCDRLPLLPIRPKPWNLQQIVVHVLLVALVHLGLILVDLEAPSHAVLAQAYFGSLLRRPPARANKSTRPALARVQAVRRRSRTRRWRRNLIPRAMMALVVGGLELQHRIAATAPVLPGHRAGFPHYTTLDPSDDAALAAGHRVI